MFGNNIGAGQSGIIACVYVGVEAKNPRGDIVVEGKGGQIIINGWLIDDSDLSKSLGYWVFDNGQPIAYHVTNAPSPYLHPYGVGGNHAFGFSYTPATSGKHDICVLGQNTGFGVNTWIDCDTVSVDVAQNDPVGELVVDVADYDANGWNDLFVDAYAYDPNDPSQSLRIVLFFDGQPIESGIADYDSRYWNPSGINGDHGYYTWLGEEGYEFSSGSHQVCLFAYNIGAGRDKLIQCENITL
uniref:hypothetical protein n=1 Tax=Cumulibacter manganitolerans TaxID=1884992 RepID=UPI0018864464